MASSFRSRRGWIVDLLNGVAIGGAVGAIVAVNLVIFGGIDQGYEAGFDEIFDQNRALGVLVVALLICGPIVGVVVARVRRRRHG